MKKIGIIGGIGPESTLEYYKGIIRYFQESGTESASPDIIIYSVNLAELVTMLEEKQLQKVAEWLLDKLRALQRAGAEFAAISANTPHVVFDQVNAASPLPLLSIVEATCRRAESLGLRKVGLMGTKFTMQADFFQQVFRKRGIEIAVPDPAGQELINERLFSEIELGIIKDSTRNELLEIARKMIETHGIEALVLGCTELPLILPDSAFGIQFLNTTAIHIESIVQYSLQD